LYVADMWLVGEDTNQGVVHRMWLERPLP